MANITFNFKVIHNVHFFRSDEISSEKNAAVDMISHENSITDVNFEATTPYYGNTKGETQYNPDSNTKEPTFSPLDLLDKCLSRGGDLPTCVVESKLYMNLFKQSTLDDKVPFSKLTTIAARLNSIGSTLKLSNDSETNAKINDLEETSAKLNEIEALIRNELSHSLMQADKNKTKSGDIFHGFYEPSDQRTHEKYLLFTTPGLKITQQMNFFPTTIEVSNDSF